MKKLIYLLLAFVVYSFPILAQNPEAESVEVPVESLNLKMGNIPQQIVKAADGLFEGSTQVAWGNFPYEFKNYGWTVYPNESGVPINRYEIKLKAKDGSDIYAVFSPKGDLIRYKVINKNAVPPRFVINSLENEGYKDWKIVGDVMLIRDNLSKVKEQYSVRIKKGDMTKTLVFDTQGENLAVK